MAVIRPRGFRWTATVAATALAVLPISGTTGVTIVGANDPNAIENSYIVVYKDGHQYRAPDDIHVTHTYSAALNGFAATMTPAQAARIARDPAVTHVEQDRTMTTTATQSPVPNWGVDRIDQATLPLDNAYTYTTTASNASIYVIDTGIHIWHSEFGGRAVWGTNTTGDGIDTDCNGHGTHLAGIAGGTSFGVAKGARLVAVKVISTCGSGSGGLGSVLAGIDWVTINHGPASVALLTLGGDVTPALDLAVQNAIAAGVPYVLSAGNSNSNACNFSPGRTPTAVTVAATTNSDFRASFSNHGPCVDLFAPGQNITSVWNNPSVINTLSGTSQAAAFVAGVAAKYLDGNPTATPAAVTTALVGAATPGVVTNPGTGSPNRLLRTIW